jgi:hypothetical protein
MAPAIALAVRLIAEPAQTGLLLPAVGATGAGFITTVVVPAALAQPPTVAVTEYVPAFATVTLPIDGFCKAEVNPPGPVQE